MPEEAVEPDGNLVPPLKAELLSRSPTTSLEDPSSRAGSLWHIQREVHSARAQNPGAGLWDQEGFLLAARSDGASSTWSGPWLPALYGTLLSAARASCAGHCMTRQPAASDFRKGCFWKPQNHV